MDYESNESRFVATRPDTGAQLIFDFDQDGPPGLRVVTAGVPPTFFIEPDALEVLVSILAWHSARLQS